jgi:hypothetical protein
MEGIYVIGQWPIVLQIIQDVSNDYLDLMPRGEKGL